MMRILLDTNVVLDVLLNREPWVIEAKALWQAHEDGNLVGYLTASTLTDIFYVARRLTSLDLAYRAIRLCFDTFEICPVDRQTLSLALNLPGTDFEDNLQVACARLTGLDAVVTRNSEDFKDAPVAILSPAEVLVQLK
ncbi:MAG: DNA-binding protein [Chloroflexota bacterium]|nr:MAG: DNA-binding protein [Chloroflexota bacterium]